MKSKLNDAVISTIKNRLPDGEQIAPFLMDLLFLGKEAIYRRLRGDVVFTFDEVAAISSKLGFSIDNLAELKQSGRVFFDGNQHLNPVLANTYCNVLSDHASFFTEMCKSKEVVGHFVHNRLPFAFSIYLETLSKFRYYKWMHLNNGFNSDPLMSEITVPANVLQMQKNWADEISLQKVHSTYIFDNNIFATLCRDINYFHKSNLVSAQEIALIQGELLFLIDFFEESTRTGVSPSGALLNLYITPFDLAANYLSLEFDNNVACYIQIHHITHVRSFDPHICKSQKQWIDQLKRYSALITQSGEMLRSAYFKKQREHVFQIGKSDA